MAAVGGKSFMSFDGPCPFPLCLDLAPHEHPICTECDAVNFSNLQCETCRVLGRLEHEAQIARWHDRRRRQRGSVAGYVFGFFLAAVVVLVAVTAVEIWTAPRAPRVVTEGHATVRYPERIDWTAVLKDVHAQVPCDASDTEIFEAGLRSGLSLEVASFRRAPECWRRGTEPPEEKVSFVDCSQVQAERWGPAARCQAYIGGVMDTGATKAEAIRNVRARRRRWLANGCIHDGVIEWRKEGGCDR
jgi:hypothetical protein